jgi:hypothetical protein
MKILNPYAKSGTWLRGSFHIHTIASTCGWHSVDEILLAYQDYDFLAITDHDRLSRLSEAAGKALFNGLEVSSPNGHMLLINPPEIILNGYSNEFSVANYQKLAELCTTNGGIAILNHPNRFSGISWRLDRMQDISGYTGIEIYSGDGVVYEEDIAFNVWDQLLSGGRKIWGFGNDDFHHWGQEKRVWNMVLTDSNTPEAILEAVRAGSFYISTGFGFETIENSAGCIRVVLKNNRVLEKMYKYITFFGRNGRKLHEVTGRVQEVEYYCTGDEGYVRVAAYHEGGQAAFSQPLVVLV